VALGARLRASFEAWQERYSNIGDVRGIGPMLGMEFVTDRESKTPAPQIVQKVIERAREHGLLLLKAGMHNNIIRVLVPLVASDQDIDDATRALESALQEVLG
jgi:4-aminobutyrate aminotransferase/(S)-3-amino-2-methylpropionate transaminase